MAIPWQGLRMKCHREVNSDICRLMYEFFSLPESQAKGATTKRAYLRPLACGSQIGQGILSILEF